MIGNMIGIALNSNIENKIKSYIDSINTCNEKNIELTKKIIDISNNSINREVNVEKNESVKNELYFSNIEINKTLKGINNIILQKKYHHFINEKKELKSELQELLQTEKKLEKDYKKTIDIFARRELLQEKLKKAENKSEYIKSKLTRKIDKCDKKVNELESAILTKADELNTFVKLLYNIEKNFKEKERKKFLKSKEYKVFVSLLNECKSNNSIVNSCTINLNKLKEEKNKIIDKLGKEEIKLTEAEKKIKQEIDKVSKQLSAADTAIGNINKKIADAIEGMNKVNKKIALDIEIIYEDELYNLNKRCNNSNASSPTNSVTGDSKFDSSSSLSSSETDQYSNADDNLPPPSAGTVTVTDNSNTSSPTNSVIEEWKL